MPNFIPQGFKRCSCCKEAFPRTTDYFYPRGGNFVSRCKACISRDNSEARADPTPEQVQHRRDLARENYHKNRDYFMAQNKARRLKRINYQTVGKNARN